jgi:D-glycero-beta-D-manno-heptose-7-phosphate kinase
MVALRFFTFFTLSRFHVFHAFTFFTGSLFYSFLVSLFLVQLPSSERLQTLLRDASGKRIAVVGDIMLDRYFWGSVSRVSPEAPVPVVDVESESMHLGGASNVAQNLHALGAEPFMVGVIGNDASGKSALELLRNTGMSTSGIITDAERPTTVKTRIIGNNQQIARLDREVRHAITETTARAIINALQSTPNLAGIVLEDYNKGVMTPKVIHDVIAFAEKQGVAVFVDPKRMNFFEYKRASLFKPNKKETQDALGYSLTSDDDVRRAGAELLERLDCHNVLITLGARGMMLFERGGAVSSVPTRARHVADVSGAGDTAIATLAAMIAAGGTYPEAAALANVAAGAVCEEPGIIAITPERLLEAHTHAEDAGSEGVGS